jgi:hypothetical protein
MSETEGDRLIAEIDATCRLIVDNDLPFLAQWERDVVVGHLTGALVARLYEFQQSRDPEPSS